MAAPNLGNPTTITGKTATVAVGDSATDVLANAVDSGKVMKINSLYISNIHADDDGTISVTVGGEEICKGVEVANASTVVVIDKESIIYLEENKKVQATAGAASTLKATISYEEVS